MNTQLVVEDSDYGGSWIPVLVKVTPDRMTNTVLGPFAKGTRLEYLQQGTDGESVWYEFLFLVPGVR